ncbi:MAG: MFS transporter [Thermoplasmata archaeon]
MPRCSRTRGAPARSSEVLWRGGRVHGPGGGGLGRYTSLLAHRPFRSLLFAGALSFAAPSATLVVLVWSLATAYPPNLSANALGQFSALALSFLGLSATVPTLVSAIFSGTLADRMPRRRLMRWTNALGLVGTLGLMAVLYAQPSSPVALPGPPGFYLPLWVLLLFPLWALVTVGVTIFRPAFNASLPRVVSTAELGSANGLVYAVAIAFSVLGSLGAPLLIGPFGLGPSLVFAVGLFAATQLVLVGVTSKVDPPPTAVARRRRFLADAGDGYRYLWHRRELLEITVSALLINLFSAVAFVELALYVKVWLAADNALLVGGMLAGASLGAGLGSVLVGRLHFEKRAGRLLALLTVLQGAAVVVLAVSRSPWISVPDMFLFGVFPGMFTTIFLATIQATVPNEMLGRVLAADEVGSYSMVPFGQYTGGLITLYGGVQITYLAAGIGTIGVGLVMGLARRVRRFGFEPQEGPSMVEPPPGALGEVPIVDVAPDPAQRLASPTG